MIRQPLTQSLVARGLDWLVRPGLQNPALDLVAPNRLLTEKAAVPRQNRGRSIIIDVGVADRHSTGDARRLRELRCGPINRVDP
jgi:hypothetical protein